MQSNLYHVTDKGNLENGHIRQVIVEWGGYCHIRQVIVEWGGYCHIRQVIVEWGGYCHIRQVIVEWGGYCKTFDWIKVKNSILFYSVAICHNKCGRSTT